MTRNFRLYLARHGQTFGHEKRTISGFTDTPLTPVGVMQMERLAERLRLVDIGHIYSSDLQRSYIGAQIVARDHNTKISQLPELRELNFGIWEGLTLSEVKEKFPEEVEKRQLNSVTYQIPNGESIVEFSNRITNCFNSIINNNNKKDILIVAHSGVNRVIICHLLSIELLKLYDIEQSYGCLNVIDFFPNNNSIIHLING